MPFRTCDISSSSDIELVIGPGRRLFVLSWVITGALEKGSRQKTIGSAANAIRWGAQTLLL
jgi:hypothetical protein